MILRIFPFLLLLAPALWGQISFEAVHKKALWPDGKGVLQFTADGVEFTPEGKEETLRWLYRDIQHLDRIGPSELELLSYDTVDWQLGRDKRFHFILVSGEISEAEYSRISERIGKPVTNRSFQAPEGGTYVTFVRHAHALGGCEGRLVFTENEVFYQSEFELHSRQWRLDRDVESVWSADPYSLELRVYEGGRKGISRTRSYRFDLKQELDEDFYRGLKLKQYRQRSDWR